MWKEWQIDSDSKLHLVTHETSSGKLKDKLIDLIYVMVYHTNLKRIQADEFQKDKLNENISIFQVDFEMTSRASVVFFTATSFYKGKYQTYLICFDVFLNKLSDLMHTESENLTSGEIIWSDGPAWEFKTPYMVKLTVK